MKTKIKSIIKTSMIATGLSLLAVLPAQAQLTDMTTMPDRISINGNIISRLYGVTLERHLEWMDEINARYIELDGKLYTGTDFFNTYVGNRFSFYRIRDFSGGYRRDTDVIRVAWHPDYAYRANSIVEPTPNPAVPIAETATFNNMEEQIHWDVFNNSNPYLNTLILHGGAFLDIEPLGNRLTYNGFHVWYIPIGSSITTFVNLDNIISVYQLGENSATRVLEEGSYTFDDIGRYQILLSGGWVVFLEVVGSDIVQPTPQPVQPNQPVQVETTPSISTPQLPNRRLTEQERQTWIKAYWEIGGATSVELEVLRLVNIERTNNGLNAVVWDDTLGMAARFFAQQAHDLRGIAGYSAPGNSHNFGPYAENQNANHGASISVARAFGANIGWTGGNWFGGGSLSAEFLVNGWMNSPGHRRYILAPEHRYLGMGQFPGGISYLFMSDRASN